MESPGIENDYYLLNAKLLIAGVKEFLLEKLSVPLTDQHLIEMLSTPMHALFPMLEKNDKAAKMIDALLEDYIYGSWDKLEEIIILARHQFSIYQQEKQTNQSAKRVTEEIKELIRIYKM